MASKNTTRYKSNIQEKRIAKELNGRVQINSGAIWSLPGDVRTDELLIEAKTTSAPAYRLSIQTWEKIRKEALHDGFRIPLMQLDISGSRFAVYQEFSFAEYRDNFMYYPTSILTSEHSSVLLRKDQSPIRIRFLEMPYLLTCISWDDFLDLLKSGKRLIDYDGSEVQGNKS